jgi:hypothetical protein
MIKVSLKENWKLEVSGPKEFKELLLKLVPMGEPQRLGDLKLGTLFFLPGSGLIYMNIWPQELGEVPAPEETFTFVYRVRLLSHDVGLFDLQDRDLLWADLQKDYLVQPLTLKLIE